MKIREDIIVVDQNICSNFVKNTDGQVLSILLSVAENGKQRRIEMHKWSNYPVFVHFMLY